MDTKTLDQKLVSFLASQSSGIPLSPRKSHTSNIPKHDVKSLQASCISSLSTLLSTDVAPDRFDTIQLRLQGLYAMMSGDSDRASRVGVLRKHQLFIVKLFELKEIDVVFVQLKILVAEIKKLLFGHGESHALFEGIPVINTNDDEVIQLVVASHFLLLQWIAQYSSKNLRQILTRGGGSEALIDVKTFQRIPCMFLTNSNFRRWQALAVKDGKKYTGNTVKLIQGFIKLFLGIKSSKYLVLADCLKIKLVEFNNDVSLLEDIEVCPELMPFINDSGIDVREMFTKSTPEEIHPDQVTSSSTNELQMKLFASPHLIHDVKLLESLKSMTMSIDSSQAIIAFFNHTKHDLPQLLNPHLSILDAITVFIKNSLSEKTVPLLTQLFAIYRHFKQQKRMRNVSNLLFNLGNKLLSNEYWNLAIEFECDIMDVSATDENFAFLFSKLGKPVLSEPVFAKFLGALEKYDKLDTLTIQFISKSLLTNPELLLNHVIDGFKSKLVLHIFTTMEKTTNTMQKTLICNSVIANLTWVDPQMMYKVQYAYYNINGLDNYLELDVMDSTNPLIVAGFQFQKLVSFAWDEETFKLCLDNFEAWASIVGEVTPFQYDVARQILLYAKFNGVTGWLLRMIDLFLANKSSIPVEFQNFLQFERCHALLNLSMDTQLSQTLLEFNQVAKSWKSIDDVLNLSLVQLEYYIKTNNLAKSQERYTGILATLKKKPEFSMAKSGELPLVQKFSNFLIIGKFQVLASHLNAKLHRPVDAYVNVKTGIQIMYSIIKKCPNNISKTHAQTLRWEIAHVLSDAYKLAIELCIHLGTSRHIAFYLHEWKKVNDGCVTPILNTVNNFEIGKYGARLGDLEFSVCGDVAKECRYDIVRKNLTVRECFELVEHAWETPPDNIYKREVIPADSLVKQMRGELVECIEEISCDKSLCKLTGSVQFLPGVVGESNTSCPKEILDRLILVKNTVLDELSKPHLPLPKNQKLLHILNQTVSILSSVASFKGGDLLSELYYLRDMAKYYPFANEHKLMKHSSKKDLLPFDIPEDTPSNMLDFNVDLLINLPASWVVITLDVCQHTGDLLVSRMTKGSSASFIRLPLTRFKQQGITPMDFSSMKHDLESIIADSNMSTKKATTSKIVTVEDRKRWWKSRFTLDYELQDIFDHVQQYWIGGFAGVFNNYSHDNVFVKFKLDFMKMLSSCLTCSKPLAFDDGVMSCVFGIDEYDRESVDDLLRYFINALSFHGEHITSIKQDKFHDLFKSLMEKYKGLKFKQPHQHIVLVPSSKCSFFPWESLACLRSKSVSRMPSVTMLLNTLKSPGVSSKIDKRDLYYLINPGGDLKRTEDRFRGHFATNTLWHGVIGHRPNEDSIVSEILDSNLFVYIGHGGCDQYVKVSSLFKACADSQRHRLPPSLLLGCSSGKLDDNGEFEPLGNVYNWLSCGTPLTLVNLWDITDKDIDAFTISVFEKWGLIDTARERFSDAVVKSRCMCTLKNLNGSAPIMYGLPMMLQ
ncbi:Separin [Candida viswanathii]|uniref:separase n=1 Tax=Candida viswanathii TaxID=5486 RepID=A0A367XRS9_9ASCO|nr:Separin [Candida viswanathii]